MYCTVPAVLLLGLSSVCAIVDPEPPVALVMLPVMVPTVHMKVLGVLAVSAILVVFPLQIAAVFAVVTTGEGFTVTVMVCVTRPGQPGVVVDVGVIIYCTVPAALLLGLVRVCAMIGPAPAEAPVMPPVMAPIVQLKVLGTVAFRMMLGEVLLQIVAVVAFVITGEGFTVTVMVYELPGQAGVTTEVGVTIY